MFKPGAEGEPATSTHDVGGYFDLAPADLGEDARRAMVAHAGADGLRGGGGAPRGGARPARDRLPLRRRADHGRQHRHVPVRGEVRRARSSGCIASFMPKPIFGQNGSGMHTHQSLFREGRNAFWDRRRRDGSCRDVALHYIGGLLRHARGLCAITNPLVNSYKRLVPGYEAPVNVAWSMRNRSPLMRVPERRGTGTRVELRMPDPSANPYLALAVMLAAGLDGVETKADYREPVDTNIFEMSLSREAPAAHRRPAARPQRGVRRAGEGPRDPGRARRAHGRALPRTPSARSGATTSRRCTGGNWRTTC